VELFFWLPPQAGGPSQAAFCQQEAADPMAPSGWLRPRQLSAPEARPSAALSFSSSARSRSSAA